MTNPFRKQEWVEIVGAELWCKKCSTVSDAGRYNDESKLVRWTCPECGFNNEEKAYGG